MVVDSAPVVVNRSPAVMDGSPVLVNDSPAVMDGSPVLVNDSPAVMDGSSCAGERFTSGDGRFTSAGKWFTSGGEGRPRTDFSGEMAVFTPDCAYPGTQHPWVSVSLKSLVVESGIGCDGAENAGFLRARLLAVRASLYWLRVQLGIGCGCKSILVAAAIAYWVCLQF